MSRLSTVIIVAVAIAVMGILVAITAHNWESIGGTGISASGWVALVLGVLATLAVGVGLMVLVFISNRRGYDDR
jgi:hypothetical protein